ncbi:G protein-regulated inducer of neurite outgrowth 2 [Lissotriton helveticus]
MASNNHRLSAHSYQEPMNCICHMSSKPSCHPLSKSSSNLLSCGQYSSDATQSITQELRKSLSGIVYQTRMPENVVPCSQDSLWSPVNNEALSNSYGTQIPDVQLSGTNMHSGGKSVNHFLTVDQPTTHWDGNGLRIHIRSSTTENVSSSTGQEEESMICKTRSTDPMEALGMLVQKSHSEFLYGCSEPIAATHHRTSATYSDFCPTSSMYEVSATNQSFHSHGYDEECSPTAQNRTDWITLARDQNSSPVSFATDAIQHNITVYTSPGTYHHSAIRLHDPENVGPDRQIRNSQSTSSLCGTACNNNSCTMHFAPAVTMHNSCAVHCHNRNEPCTKVSDTVAAYCHSMPIPSIKLAPRLGAASVSQSGREQLTASYCLPLPVSDMVTFPKLACSVSESGLDAKWLMTCGNTSGEQSPLLCKERMDADGTEPNRTDLPANTSTASFNGKMLAKTRDTGTMTALDICTMVLKPTNEYKDAEVQTVAHLETKSAATSPSPLGGNHSHVFPEVSLKLDLQGSPTPVHEVRWDDEGMTWEVYGASVDPEVLGLAIQKHLEIQIEEHLKPAESPNKDTVVPPTKDEKRRSLRTIIYSLRRSSCCVRSSAALE